MGRESNERPRQLNWSRVWVTCVVSCRARVDLSCRERSLAARRAQLGLASRYVKCLFTGITYAFCLAHNSSGLAVVAKMMMANGSTTTILQAISNLLIVIKWFVKLVGLFLSPTREKVNVSWPNPNKYTEINRRCENRRKTSFSQITNHQLMKRCQFKDGPKDTSQTRG